jgi:uncharacterized protein with LGFP repeats
MRRMLALPSKHSVVIAALALCAVAAARPANAGVFADKYAKLGGSSGPLGASTSAINKCADGVGLYQTFVHGALYYLPSLGDAFAVYGSFYDGGIYAKWSSLGLERSLLGYPITDVTGCPDGRGRYNHFQFGSIYWTPETGAHETHGAIRDKWAELGWERGFGYPLTDELTTPDGKGRFQDFERCSIHWTPETGAHETHGAIRGLWASMGWERSWLGYPTSDEQAYPGVNGGRVNYFQGGYIVWVPVPGFGAVAKHYQQ